VEVRVDGEDETLTEGARAGRRPRGTEADTPEGASLRALRVLIEIEENR
jgi:hypothetical protein